MQRATATYTAGRTTSALAVQKAIPINPNRITTTRLTPHPGQAWRTAMAMKNTPNPRKITRPSLRPDQADSGSATNAPATQ